MQCLMTERTRDSRGAVAMLVAAFMTGMLVITAMVLDFGLARIDRQINKSAADSAATAGAYGLNGNDTAARPFAGACQALRYLQANDRRFTDLTSADGTWSDAAGVAVGDGCADSTLLQQTCEPTDPGTWARFAWSSTWQGAPISVVIQSGYDLRSGAGAAWNEESLLAVQQDNDDGQSGCYQLVVSISQSRNPTLGSLATTTDLRSSVRSVVRVSPMPGSDAPAMVLLRRTGCPTLGTGSGGLGGGGSFVHVLGVASPVNGRSQPGTIHTDASGAGCNGSPGNHAFWGRNPLGGIVAYADPVTGRPGQISSVAVANGIAADDPRVSDGLAQVHGSNAAVVGAGVMSPVVGRTLVTRYPADERYLGTISPRAGVKGIVDVAQSTVFSRPASPTSAWTTAGYALTTACPTTGASRGIIPSLPALNASRSLYVRCPAELRGIPPLTGWRNIVFNGSLNPTGTISAPDAEKIYVFGPTGTAGVALNTQNASSEFRVRTPASGLPCSSVTADSSAKAILVVRNGAITQNGGTLQLCNTTVVMMSGNADACLPTYSGTVGPAPSATPCPRTPTAAPGSGQIQKNGGAIDWTAPNRETEMTLADGSPDPSKAGLWTSLDGPEDLAFWSESANIPSGASAYSFNMTGGGGSLNTTGVFMTPNADPFTIGGNAAHVLTNAQYFLSSMALNGTTTSVTMSVDPNSAITIPRLGPVGLVR